VLLLQLALPLQAEIHWGKAETWAQDSAIFGGVLLLGLTAVNAADAWKQGTQNFTQAVQLEIASAALCGAGGVAGGGLFIFSKIRQCQDRDFRMPLLVGMSTSTVFPLAATALSVGSSVLAPRAVSIIISSFSGVATIAYGLAAVTSFLIKQRFQEF
jgi:hypothetical protein